MIAGRNKENDTIVEPMNPENTNEKDVLLEAINGIEQGKDVIMEAMNFGIDNAKKVIDDAIRSGKEVRQYVRIHVIGKDSVGKTSLVRRLLGQGFELETKSTDGIDITRNCQIRAENGQWTASAVASERTKMGERILQVVNMKHKQKTTVSDQPLPLKNPVIKTQVKPKSQKQNTAEDHLLHTEKKENETLPAHENEPLLSQVKYDPEILNSNAVSNIKSNELETNNTKQHSLDVSIFKKAGQIDTREKTKAIEKPIETYLKFPNEMPDSPSLPHEDANPIIMEKTDQIVDELIEMLKDPINKKEIKTSDGLIECGIWDFAGQKDYYATHQTFFTPYAIYLLVVDINEDITTFTYDDQSDFNSSGEYIDFWFDSIHCFCEKTSADKLCPPVIMVCTGIDKLEDEQVNFRMSKFKSDFRDKFRGQKKVNHKEIEILQKYISQIAEEMKYFAELLPTRWIKLENELDILKEMKETVLSWKNIMKLADTNLIRETELLRFLNYQHKIGNIIFFEDKRDFIILRPNWLVECFRCLICDDAKKHHDSSLGTDMSNLEHEGKLSLRLLDDLFKKEPDLQFGKFKTHILDVMMKFDIILKIDNSFYMPCMIKKSATMNEIKHDLRAQKCFLHTLVNPGIRISTHCIL
ncbi:unnamed protein product [Mytilus edulis]|uniref:COR domain-containing protein n=1 Tax=Mytilus edulis TaxID=6550 RepID=A0A8S3TPX8_MYTED|nr:unnamed protein product [Mytilus edulis]